MSKALPLADSEFFVTMRDRFQLADSSQSEQAKREERAIRFENDDQTTPDISKARAGMDADGNFPAVPARPWIIVNKLKEPVRQVLNQERSADIGIELVPANDFGDLGLTPDDTEVTLREGLIRRIQRESIAADARTWAFKRAVIAGRGYYMVMTRFLPGRTFDQEIYVHRIYNQAGVLLDPSHEQPDGSDSDWGFVGTWMPWDRFKDTYPEDVEGNRSPFADATAQDFVSMAEAYPDWYQGGDTAQEAAVRIVDYWYTKRTIRSIVQMDDGTILWNESAPDDVTPDAAKDYLPAGMKPFKASLPNVRDIVEKQIKFCKVAGGTMELERTDWPGPDMPIVKVIGDEVLPYDNERRYKGIVEPAIDAQMGENYMISKLVEVVGMQPIPLLQLDPDAIEGYETWYQQINTRALPYAPYRSRDDEGRELRPPVRLPVDPNTQHLAQAVGMFDTFIKSTTAVPDSTLGNVDPSLKSGRAIREVVANAQVSTSNYLDNLARSMRYEGQIENNLLYPIYGTKPGRLLRIINGEGSKESMRVGDPKAQAQQQSAEKVARLTKDAHFNVAFKIGKSAELRSREFEETFGNILSADPSQMAIGGDLFYKNSNIPFAKEMAERQRVMLAPPVQAMLVAKEQGQNFDPIAQAEIAKLKEQLQHGEQAMSELADEARGKKIESVTKLQIEQLQGQRDVQLEQIKQDAAIELQRMKDATSIRVAEIAAETKGIVSGHEAAHEAHALHVELAHDATQAELDRQSAAQAVASQQEHEAAQAAAGAGVQQDQTTQAQQFQAEQSEADRQAAAEQAERPEEVE